MATCINWEEIFKRDKSFGVRLLLEHRSESSIWILEDSFFWSKGVRVRSLARVICCGRNNAGRSIDFIAS